MSTQAMSTAAPGALAGTAPEKEPRSRSIRMQETIAGWTFLAPNLVLLGVFLFLPVLWALVLSFQSTLGFGETTFAGFSNYLTLASDPVFWQSLGNTALFTLLTVPVGMGIGLGLAVLLNSVLPARGVVRTIVVLPMVISGVATGLVSVLLFGEGTGVIDKLFGLVGLGGIAWQSDGVPAFISIVLVTLWTRIGFNMIVYLAGLQGISNELHEAATLDGAGGWQRFRYLTVPLVGPSTFFLLIMNVIYSFQVFDIVFVLTQGGPGYSTSVLVTYAYENAFETRAQGYGAAIGIVLLLLTLAFTAVQWRISKTRDLVE
jgi:multiple sugar transport system permease protein